MEGRSTVSEVVLISAQSGDAIAKTSNRYSVNTMDLLPRVNRATTQAVS